MQTNTKISTNKTKYFFIFSLVFFALGFFNIIFGWLGFICMVLPFVLLAKDQKKTWCQNYCPRANLFNVLFKNRSFLGKIGPDWIIKGKGKWVILGYFSINLFVITMSTIAVSKGKILPMEHIRFLMAFQLPFDIPQILHWQWGSDWAVHLSYRIYSMMFTTTILGFILAWLFKPRTWCTVCPINTVSELILKNHKT